MSWQDRCREAGHVPTVFPDGPHAGEDACQYIDQSGVKRYALPDYSIVERLEDFASDAGHAVVAGVKGVAHGVGSAVGAVGDATGLDHGLLGVGAKVLGVNYWMYLALIGVVGYGLWRNRGEIVKLGKEVGVL